MTTAGYRCPAGTCRNTVADPLVPCEECQALYGEHLRATGRLMPEDEIAILRARASAAVTTTPSRLHLGRPAAVTASVQAEEAVHFVWWCGFSVDETARRLGVSRNCVRAYLRAAEEAG